MDGYYLAATCTSVGLDGTVTVTQSDEGGPEFNQLDLNMCVGYDQGATDGVGKLTWGPL